MVQVDGLAPPPAETREFGDDVVDTIVNPDILCNVTSDGNRLIGTIVDPDHGLHLKIYIEWTESTEIGEISMSTVSKLPEDSDAELFDEEVEGTPALLLRFSLKNRTNNFLVSQGDFLGNVPGSYQLTLPNLESFILTIFYPNSTFISISGQKRLPNPELTFWARWSTPLMFFGLFLMTAMRQPRPPNVPVQPNRQQTIPRATPGRPEDKQD